MMAQFFEQNVNMFRTPILFYMYLTRGDTKADTLHRLLITRAEGRYVGNSARS